MQNAKLTLLGVGLWLTIGATVLGAVDAAWMLAAQGVRSVDLVRFAQPLIAYLAAEVIFSFANLSEGRKLGRRTLMLRPGEERNIARKPR